MRILSWLPISAPQPAEVATAGAGNRESVVPQPSDTPTPEDPDADKQGPEKWRDTGQGFLHAQLGDQDRMDRYNLHMTITTLRRCVYWALGAASLMGSTAAYVARTPGSGKDKEIMVLGALAVSAVFFATTALIGMTVLALGRLGSLKKATGEIQGQAEQSPNA